MNLSHRRKNDDDENGTGNAADIDYSSAQFVSEPTIISDRQGHQEVVDGH